MAKTVLLICAQAFLFQCISSQCYGSTYNAYSDGLVWGAGNTLAWDGIGPYGSYGAAATPFAAPYTIEWAGYGPASSGGGFVISSGSPIAPTGVAITSENAYEGALAVSGALPFLGAVALEGPLPTLGSGAVTYGCGNGNVAILNEDYGYAGYGSYGYGPAELGYGYAAAPLAYEAIAGPAYGYRGCGYSPVY